MKKHILLVLILTIAISLNTIAQLVNCNPDPQGDPWWAGGDIALTEAEWAMIPQLTLTTESAATTLLDVVDNSQLQYFPPIFQQIGGSCAQAAGIGYIFTYEINRERDVAANTNTNLYPHMHTYNFLHKNNKGSNTIDGWRIAQENGIPNEVVYDNPYVEGDPEVLLFWMSGYEKYYSAMNNRISGYWSIEFDISGNNFDLVQHWINDHNAGKTTGGIAKLSTVLVEIIDYGTYEPGLPQAGKKFVKQWGTDPGSKHALTIVGYDDEVKYDWNNDGQYTNTDDINDDGEVNMWDWEIGAVKLANSWGNKWPTQFDEGFIYMPYKLFGTTGGPDFKVLVCEAEESHETEIVFKSELFHGDRELFGFGVTYGIDANSNPVGVGENAGSFWQQGGPEPINGINNNPLEFAFDFGYFYGDEDFGQVYATIFNTSSTNYAEFESFSMIDYRWEEEFELFYSDSPFNVGNGLHFLGIPYDLIPHETYITSNLTFDTDMVSRFNPTVSNGAILTVDDGVQIDMYESELEITSTASLVIDDNATFIAKDGICKITIDGTLSIGSDVSFLAEDNAQLQLVLNNTGLTLAINGCNFDGAAIISNIDDLTVTNSDFIDAVIYGSKGDYTISSTDFDNSFVHISDASGNENTVEITNNCTFSNAVSPITYAVKIDDYPNFTIDDCIFDNNNYGVYALNSGDGRDGSEITNCEFTDHSYPAIQVYNTDVDIIDNEISDNGYGIKIYNNSNVKLSGSDNPTPTQTIEDNTWYEVYASSGSFPYYFHWNAIIDNDNPQPMVYYSGSTGELDVTNNYWGTSFSYLTDLYPSTLYDWDPVWDPYSKSSSVAESLYESALEKIAIEVYNGAKTDLKEIVSDNYTSIFAQAALKKLFAIEQYDGNDYAALKLFYEEEQGIQQNEELIKISDFLINFCEIKMENWQTAINWFENVIQEPEQMEDSIFAIIDLGYTYLWMQNSGYKSAYAGTMAEHIPANKEQFEDKRDYLLSLLPGEQLSEQMLENISQLKTGELLQNVPNPFNGNTQIWYKLEEGSSVTVNVFDYTGKKVRTYNQGIREKGSHYFEFSSDKLPAGIYFYSLEVNGKVTDSKKMTLMR